MNIGTVIAGIVPFLLIIVVLDFIKLIELDQFDWTVLTVFFIGAIAGRTFMKLFGHKFRQ